MSKTNLLKTDQYGYTKGKRFKVESHFKHLLAFLSTRLSHATLKHWSRSLQMYHLSSMIRYLIMCGNVLQSVVHFMREDAPVYMSLLQVARRPPPIANGGFEGLRRRSQDR